MTPGPIKKSPPADTTSPNAHELEREGLFRVLAEHSVAGVYLIQDGVFVYINPRLAELFGYRQEELMGKKGPKDVVHPDDWPIVSENIRKRIDGEIRTVNYEFRCIKQTGEVFDVEVYGSRVMYEGRPAVIGTLLDVSERLRAQEALRESEERFRTAFASANDGMSLGSPDGRFLMVNQALCDMLGYSENELLALTFEDITHPDDVNESLDRLRKVQMGEIGAFRLEKRYLHKSGRTIWAVLSVAAVRDVDDRVLYSISQIHDITEKKMAVEDLRRRKEYLETIMDSSLDLIITVRPDGAIHYVNTRLKEVLGYDADEVIGRHFLEFIPRELHKSMFKRWSEIQGGTSGEYETKVLRKNGGTIDARVSHAPLKGTNEYLAVIEDVTDVRLAEEQVRTQAELLDLTTDSVFLHDLEGNFLYVNEAAYASRGYTLDELLALNLRALDVPAFAEKIRIRMEELIAKGESRFESAHFRKDGSIMPVEVHARIVESGGTPLVLSAVRDITERQQMDQLKSDFVAAVSHELRSPLAVILGHASVIERCAEAADTEGCLRSARSISERGTHMARVVGSILDVSQVQSGSFGLNLRTVDVADLLARAADCSVLTDAHKLELRISPDVDHMVCDADKLSIALINIISNAAKFSPDGGAVRVSAEKDTDSILISVEDEGIGVAEGDRARIFERFTQADMSATRNFGGSGLGLYIARQVAQAHGGDISVKSVVGEGSTFIVRLPALPAPPVAEES